MLVWNPYGSLRLFELLRLQRVKGSFIPRRRQQASLFFPSMVQEDPTQSLICLSGQSSSLASTLLTWSRQQMGAEFDTQQGLTKTLSIEEIRRYLKRKMTLDCSESMAPADQQSPNSFEILCPNQSPPAGYDPVPFDWRHVGTNHGDALLLRPCECFWLYAPF